MPLYSYRCTKCAQVTEVVQSHAEMMKRRNKQRCVACESPMEFMFPSPALVTDTTFVAAQQDPFNDIQCLYRKRAYRHARALGINPATHSYNPFFADKRGPSDPEAWIPHDRARQSVRSQCERWQYDCQGGVNHQTTVRDVPDDPEPYTVAEDIVQREVQKVVEKNDGDVTPSEQVELANDIRERGSGR